MPKANHKPKANQRDGSFGLQTKGTVLSVCKIANQRDGSFGL